MRHPKTLARSLFFLFLLACLLTGLVGSVNVPVSAAPGDADLSLAMSVNNAAPNKADTVIFTITVTNNSTVDIANGVIVQDVLPVGLSYISSNGTGTYDNSNGNWAAGDLATGASVSINIVTNATTTDPKTNLATITTPTTDPNPTNNSASVTVTPKSADLRMAIDAPSNPAPNKTDPVIFTITVSNAGPNVATGVTVNVPLPAGLAYVSDSGAGTYNAGIWTVGTVASGGSVTLNIIANVTTIGPKSVSAEVRTSNQLDIDSTPGNGIASEDDYATSSQVTPKVSDLRVVIPVPPSPPQNSSFNIGDIVVFRIEVSNETLAVPGASNATGVRVSDLLPTGLVFISYISSSGTYTTSTGNWSVGNLNIGATKWLEITASVTNTNTKINVAEVTEADQLDSDSTPGNGITSEDDYKSVTLNAPSADLAVTMSVNNTTPNKADNVIFTITVSNTGSSPATGVTVKDLLPAGLTWQSDNGAGTYNNTTGVWLVGSLPAGSSDILTITTRATTTGAKINTASILTSNQADANTANNSDSKTVTPNAGDLSLSKTINNSNPSIGSNAVFTITVNNTGPQGVTGVTVKDLLPPGFSFVSYTGSGSYNNTDGIWNIGSLANGANVSLNITVKAESNPDKTNRAEVWSSDQLDPDSTPQNNSTSEDDDDAAPKVDLSLTKTVNNAVPPQGSNIIFTLKVNNAGPAPASGVVVKDLLPSGFSYVSMSGEGTYTSGNGLWSVGTLAVGATKTMTITAKATTMGAYSNYAQVWASDQYDVDSVPGDDSTTTDDDEAVSISVSYPAMSILINEVAWMGTAASVNDEWIELYNPGTTPISLTGWVLKAVDGTPTINLLNGYILQPDEYFLLERTDDTTVSDILANQLFTGDIGNSSEVLQLIDPLNRIVDTANSNSGNWPAGSSTTFGSMERRGVMVDSDTAWITNTGVVAWGKDAGTPNDCTVTTTACLTVPKILKGTPKHLNWAFSVVPTPSPVATAVRTPTLPPPPPPPLLVINEFLPRPGHDWNNDGLINTGDEYIEILNHGVVDVNLGGYKLDDEANIGSPLFSLPSDVTLKPGERIVFYGSQTGLLLSDGGDGVRLLKSNGQLMDAYNYPIVDFPDQAFCRLPDNGGADDWNTHCYPTPGLKNSLSGSMLRPPTQNDEDNPLCPIADTLPDGFILAECSPFGNNIWSRYYWDKFGWYGEKSLLNVNSRWDVYAD